MSNYRDFITDYPDRAQKLLASVKNTEIGKKHNVTLMLSFATPCVIIPFERLRPPRSHQTPHPAKVRARFKKAKKDFDKFLKKSKFLAEFSDDPKNHSWTFNTLESVSGDPDGWPDVGDKDMTDQKTAKAILKHLRNALAHGNIFTRADDLNKIDMLVFLSETHLGSGKFNCLTVSPDDFYTFLVKWIEFLKTLNQPAIAIPEGSSDFIQDH